MTNVRVLQIIDSLNTGGAEVLAVNIANLLSKKGVESHLCTTRLEGDLLNNIHRNVGYIYLNKKRIIDIQALKSIKKYIIKNNINVVHAHSSSYFFASCIKIIYPKIKVVWHNHFGLITKIKGKKLLAIKLFSNIFSSIIVVNKNLLNWSIENLNCKNVFHLNNFAVFNNQKKTTLLKGEKGKRIVHLAGFRPDKDHETLIRAFSIFLKNHKDWTLHFIGKVYNDTYSKKIINLIKEKELEKHTFVYGSCLNIQSILNQATIGVLSSKSEGLPLALLEYGISKLPVVTTNVGDCNKVIINNISGFVVPAKNEFEYSTKLNELANSKELITRFSENLYNHVHKNYSSKTFINHLIKIYNK